MSFILAADTGGTFTDFAAYDSQSGSVLYTKSLTTYDDLVQGVMNCVAKAGVDLSNAEVVKFGTTLVINTYVQRNGAKTALLCTEGFRDVLDIRRGNRSSPFDLRYKREDALTPRQLRFSVAERMTPAGETLCAVNSAEIEEIANKLKQLDVEAVAVSFINAYADPSHEQEVAQALRRLLPGVYVTAGTDLSREWYEYERTSTAVANAYVGPKLKDYVSRLHDRLTEEGFAKSFFLMASNGGAFSLARAERQPVMLVESGPVGGCVGAGIFAGEFGLDKVIAFDMGGTTAKCAVIENGHFEVRSPYYVGGVERGFPVRGGVLDIIEVGTGGGSVAWIDPQGALCVGPRSAGSTPGPVCYGRGGTEPTMTDANLSLGRIGESSFLGGEMRVDGEAARNAIIDLGRDLGLDMAAGPDEMARGILDLGALSMASAIKQVTVERGLDVTEYALFAFGGGGPLHAAELARELNIPHVVIPPEPGNFSALGMILAKARVDESLTFIEPLTATSLDAMHRAFGEMEAELQEGMRRDFGDVPVQFEHQVELVFKGQKHPVRIPLPGERSVEAIRSAFKDSYLRRYGHVEADAPVQFVGLVLAATAEIRRPRPQDLKAGAADGEGNAPLSTRPIYFAERRSRLDTPVYRRASLAPGFSAHGPAVIEEYGSTTVIGPDDRFDIGVLGEINIRFDQP